MIEEGILQQNSAHESVSLLQFLHFKQTKRERGIPVEKWSCNYANYTTMHKPHQDLGKSKSVANVGRCSQKLRINHRVDGRVFEEGIVQRNSLHDPVHLLHFLSFYVAKERKGHSSREMGRQLCQLDIHFAGCKSRL